MVGDVGVDMPVPQHLVCTLSSLFFSFSSAFYVSLYFIFSEINRDENIVTGCTLMLSESDYQQV